MKWPRRVSVALATVVTLLGVASAPAAKGQGKKPNILVIMGDDIGWFNIGACLPPGHYVWEDAEP